uniref:TIL domain-containing protein n=1 Tax=Anopheles funestus TaxID=62324 RepID=A0A182R9Z6_ANOFN
MKISIAFFLLAVTVVLDEVHGQAEEEIVPIVDLEIVDLEGRPVLPVLPFEPCFAWIRPIPRCPANERYTCCRPCIEPACRTRIVCVKCRSCTAGCVCIDGYIRSTPGGRCIPIAQCRKIEIFF